MRRARRNIYNSFFLATRDEEGASAVEYAILITMISALIIASVGSLGISTSDAFRTISSELSDLVIAVDEDKCGGKDSEDDRDCGIGNDK